MTKLFRALVLSFVLVVFSGAGSGVEALRLESVAYAQSTPEGLSKLEAKVNDIAALIQKLLYVFVGLGILFCGFRFISGDPHAWRYTLTVVVGACIIFASGEILTWLQR